MTSTIYSLLLVYISVTLLNFYHKGWGNLWSLIISKLTLVNISAVVLYLLLNCQFTQTEWSFM